MADKFRTYRADHAESGPNSGVTRWMQGTQSQAYLQAWARLFDALLDSFKQASQASFVDLGPADALAWLGKESSIPRYPGHTDTTYRAWIARRWELHQMAGTAAGILAALAEIGFTQAAVYTVLGDPMPAESPWPPDSDLANWSRFWILLDCTTATGANPLSWDVTLWDEGRAWDEGQTWDSTATVEEIALLRGVVKTWKAAHEVCAGIYVDLDGGRVRWPGR